MVTLLFPKQRKLMTVTILKAMPKYFVIGERNAPNHVKTSMSEPILVNPNSLKT